MNMKQKTLRSLNLTILIFIFHVAIMAQAAQQIKVDKVIMHKNKPRNWVETVPDPAAVSDPTPIDPNAKSGKVIVFKSGTGGINTSPLPAVYVSGSKAEVSATFVNTNSCAPKSIFVKGVATVGNVTYNLPVKALTLKHGECTYPPTAFKEAFPDGLVMCNESFIINWFSTDNPEAKKVPEPSGIEWSSAGESSCFVMVVHDKPKKGIIQNGEENTTFLLSSIYISCNAADGLITSNKDEVTLKIFDVFRTLGLKKYKSEWNLQYWGGINPLQNNLECRSISGLLKYRDANCGEWASFLQDMLKMHGITRGKLTTLTCYEPYTQNKSFGVLDETSKTQLNSEIQAFFGNNASKIKKLHPEYTDPVTGEKKDDESQVLSYFFVKNHQFSNSQKFYLYNVEYQNTASVFPSSEIVDGITISASNPLRDGAKGQGNDDPRSYFENHALLTYTSQNGVIYLDPSYGTPQQGTSFSSKNLYEDASMAGFGTMLFYEINDEEGYYIIWLKEQNSANTQLNFD